MKTISITRLLCALCVWTSCMSVSAQTPIAAYVKKSYMVPMRDGVKLFTVVLTPAKGTRKVPFIIHRTPYGAEIPIAEDSTLATSSMGYSKTMAREGYIFVFQDIRGKHGSEGTMQIHTPIIHRVQPGTVDESTDTWDTVDWLIRNIQNNNGKAGLAGTSYPGWLSLVGSIDPHPALRASTEEACMADLFLGDDFHHNGAFRLSYGMEYSYSVEAEKGIADFSFPRVDLYDWYLKLGPLKNVNDLYFHNRIPTWNNFVAHPNYDSFWQMNSPLTYMKYPEIPMLHVGGYYDQEDINGPQLMYSYLEKKDSSRRNYLLLGPWNHGQWSRLRADSLGMISFGGNTAAKFHDLQKAWFDYWLKGIGDGKFREATCFQTGTNTWKSYDIWPPRNAKPSKLYTVANHTCSFTKPTGSSSVQYPSDPTDPIPYRARPIEPTYSDSSRWFDWHVEDQRFVASRPDVAVFTATPLSKNLTVTGAVTAHLSVMTTGSDADFVVKLIDVYPDNAGTMKGYQLPVAMEVFRGRFRNSFEKPAPMKANSQETVIIDLHQINHTFLKGHQIMIQIQSTWFPVIDRNPQKYVSNIFEASADDYEKATITINCNGSTYIDLPVAEQ